MTTDRPAAPARNTALAQSPSGARAASSMPAPPTDMFSAMLGTVTQRPEQSSSRQPRNNDRSDRGNDQAVSRPTKDAPKPKAAEDTKDVDPKDQLEDAEKPKPGRLVTPELFALQLASPLPTTPAAAPATTATLQGMPGDAQAQAQAQLQPTQTAQPLPGTQPLPAFASQLPTAATQAQVQVDALLATPADGQPAPTPAPPSNGGIALSMLAGLTPTPADAPATTPAPQAQPASRTDAPATPQPDAPAFTPPNPADAQQQANTGGQPQNQPAPTPVPDAAPVAGKPVDQAPAPVVNTTPAVTPVVAPPVPLNTVTGLQRLVPLSRVPETTATMIQIAADRGVTHARLNLKPVELGGIEVRLKTTPQGISAHLVADSPEAAKMLQSAAADLRRDLEARDVNLLSLDVSTSSEQQQQNPQAQAGAFTDEFGNAQTYGLGRRNSRNSDSGLTEPGAPAETTLVLPNGVLVDVLA